MLKAAIQISFPQCGNIISIVWKNGEKVFHCVENLLFGGGPRGMDLRYKEQGT